MQTIIERLQTGDPEVWEDTFRCLYPVAFESARPRLGQSLFHECEDVATETLTALFETISTVSSENELKPLTAAIARNKAADRVRRNCAFKRGAGEVESLENLSENDELPIADHAHENLFDSLAVNEMRELIVELAANVKKEYRIVVRDFYVEQRTYAEISQKRGISVGSVGVYVQRGLTAMRTTLSKNPQLRAEFLEMVGDEALVKTILPLLSSVQLGGQLSLAHRGDIIKHRGATSVWIGEDEPPDDVKLNLAPEILPESRQPSQKSSERMTTELKWRFPDQYDAWIKKRDEDEEILTKERQDFAARVKKRRFRVLVALVLILFCVIAAAVLLLR